MTLQIVTLNVRGLLDVNKRRTIFEYYRKRANVICLQETHSTAECEQVWKNEWGGHILYAHGTSNSKGVCILIKKELPLNIVKTYSHEEGRYILCEIEDQNNPQNRITLICLYGPNKDQPFLFEDIAKQMQQFRGEYILIGDFNVVLNVHLDRRESITNNRKVKKILEAICDELSLVDVWRVRNPEVKEYSWMRIKNKTISASRIDYALVTQGLADKVQNAMYLAGIQSDHRAYFIAIDVNQIDRGRGYWKLNTLHLQKKEFYDCINSCIEKTKEQYTELDPMEKWIYLNKQMTTAAKEYSKNCRAEKDLIISQLSEKLTEMESSLEQHVTDYKYIKIMEETRSELNEMLEERIKGVIFRTKCNWHENIEQTNSKYLFNLEKIRYNAKVCDKILTDDDVEITDIKDILKYQKIFYQDLYRSDTNVKFTLENKTGICVSEDIRQKHNEPFSKEEILKAIKQMNTGKCPGSDGFPIEFYKVFWTRIGDIFYEAIQYSYDNKALHRTMCNGIINLIPKSTKDSRRLAHLRPLTLL